MQKKTPISIILLGLVLLSIFSLNLPVQPLTLSETSIPTLSPLAGNFNQTNSNPIQNSIIYNEWDTGETIIADLQFRNTTIDFESVKAGYNIGGTGYTVDVYQDGYNNTLLEDSLNYTVWISTGGYDRFISFKILCQQEGTVYYLVGNLAEPDYMTGTIAITDDYIDQNGFVYFTLRGDDGDYDVNLFIDNLETGLSEFLDKCDGSAEFMQIDQFLFVPNTYTLYNRCEKKLISENTKEYRLEIENPSYETIITIYKPLYLNYSHIEPYGVDIITGDSLIITKTLPVTYTIYFTKIQKQYLSISEVSLDYLKDLSFESSSETDWFDYANRLHDHGGYETNSSVVFDGFSSLRMSATTGHYASIAITIDQIVSGEMYISGSYLVESHTDNPRIGWDKNNDGTHEYTELDNNLNKWTPFFVHITNIQVGFSFYTFPDNSYGVVFLDNVRLWRSNHQFEIVSKDIIKSSGRIQNWGLNSYVPYTKVNLTYWDRCDSVKITSGITQTDSYGYYSYYINRSLYEEFQDTREIEVTVFCNSSFIYDPDLISYWRFDENGGSIAHDLISGYDATFANSPVWSEGYFEQGLDFEQGDNDYLLVSDQNDYTPNLAGQDQPISVSLYYKAESLWGSSNYLISKYGASGSREWLLYVLTNGQVDWYFCDTTGSNKIYIRSVDPIIPTDNFVCLTATYNGNETSQGMAMYLNGKPVEVTYNSAGIYTGLTNTGESLTIGDNGNTIDGIIDDVRIYNKELRQSDVEDIVRNNPTYSSYQPLEPTIYPNYYQKEPILNEHDFIEQDSDNAGLIWGGSMIEENGYAMVNDSWPNGLFVATDNINQYNYFAFRFKVQDDTSCTVGFYKGSGVYYWTQTGDFTDWTEIEVERSWSFTYEFMTIGIYGLDSGKAIYFDYLRYGMCYNSELIQTSEYAYMESKNRSLAYDIQIDDDSQGLYLDYQYFYLRVGEIGTHIINATALTDLQRQNILFLPRTSYLGEYEITFFLNIENYYLTDYTVNLHLFSSDPANYYIYENDSLINSGSLQESSNSISHTRNTDSGTFIELAYKFENSSTIKWFNTSYNNAVEEQLQWQVYFSYTDGIGIGHTWESFKLSINGTRQFDRSVNVYNGTCLNITVEDYFNQSLYNGEHTITNNTEITIIIDMYELIFYNNNSEYDSLVIITRNSQELNLTVSPLSYTTHRFTEGNYSLDIYYIVDSTLVNVSNLSDFTNGIHKLKSIDISIGPSLKILGEPQDSYSISVGGPEATPTIIEVIVNWFVLTNIIPIILTALLVSFLNTLLGYIWRTRLVEPIDQKVDFPIMKKRIQSPIVKATSMLSPNELLHKRLSRQKDTNRR